MSTPPSVKPGRARLTTSVRTLMLFILLVASWLAWTIHRERSQRQAVGTLRQNGAIVLYDYEALGRMKVPTARHSAPMWLWRILGDDFFQNVTYVNLTPAVNHRYQLADHDLAPLDSLGRLEELNLSDAPITDVGLAHLKGLTNLRRLFLINSPRPMAPRLRVTDAGLASLAGMTRLQELDLFGLGIRDAGMAHLAGMSDLQELGLMHSGVTGVGLVELGRMTKLIKLRLAETPLTDEGLANLPALPSLQELWLYRTKTTDAGLAHLTRFATLRTLRLGLENSSDAGIVHLAKLTNLRVLELAGERVTDAGLIHLGQSTNLKELHLAHTRVTDAGVRGLPEALPNLKIVR
jgi:internalin A